jgi:hypothetical protein
MILKTGLCYIDSSGKKCPQIQKTALGRLHYAGSNGYFTETGVSECSQDPYLVAEWVISHITPPAECLPKFQDLNDAAKGELLLAQYQGKPLEVYDKGNGWIAVYPNSRRLNPVECFRIKPEPELITGTVEIVNGKPDFKTWKKLDNEK